MSGDEQQKRKLQSLINKGLKLALRRDRLCNTKILHKDARLASWETRARLALNKLMFKFKYKYKEDFLDGVEGVTRSRMGTVYKLEKPNTSQFCNSVSYKCRKLWNDLPTWLRSIDTRDTFNVLLKAYYRDSYFSDQS